MIKTIIAIIVVSSLSISANASPIAIKGTVANGGEFHLSATRGRVVAITLVSRYTRGELEKINEALKPELGPAVDLVTVIDFVGIPRLFFGFARMQIAAASKATPVQFVVDDDSHWGPALGAAPDRRVDILVLDRHGELRGHFVGLNQVDAARRLMRELRSAIESADDTRSTPADPAPGRGLPQRSSSTASAASARPHADDEGRQKPLS